MTRTWNKDGNDYRDTRLITERLRHGFLTCYSPMIASIFYPVLMRSNGQLKRVYQRIYPSILCWSLNTAHLKIRPIFRFTLTTVQIVSASYSVLLGI